MNCDPKSLLQAARCYQCIPPGVMRSVMVSLLCEWAQATDGHEAETIAYEEAIVAAGGTISETSLNCVDQFVLDCKAANIWEKLWDVGLFMGDQLAAALVKLKDYSGTTPSLLNTNFIAGDYSEATGLVGDGATKYLDTGVITDPMGLLSVYARQRGIISTSTDPIGEIDAADIIGIRLMVGTTRIRGWWDGAAMGVPQASTFIDSNLGLLSTTCSPTAQLELNINGITVSSVPGPFAKSSNGQTAYLFATNGAGVNFHYWPGTMSFYAMGDSFTGSEMASLYTAVQALQTCLGRQV